MKLLLASIVVLFCSLTASARAASDADVTLVKVAKVVIEEEVITITVTEATTRITLVSATHDPNYSGDRWLGMPVTRVQVISEKATFTIKRGKEAAPGGVLAKVWQESLKTAKDLQDGKEVGHIGFYAPDIVIKGNMIDSIVGVGYLYPKRK
ncbi:hypothetical protein [Verrucomicrobium sp. BvORR106]|uniref:hypothetical protein n=1 Tax=Verrucomicrobium sp. BvORR106 TaxID=1403819 RepID=UPI00056E83C9|nr:hypothetical protein [Verrucomicrobium sp. BvORR106]